MEYISSADRLLVFIPEMSQERDTVKKNTRWLQKQLKDFPAKMHKSPRAVLEFKSLKEAEEMRQLFAEDQIFLVPFKDTTIYITMTALHTPDDLDQLSVSLKKVLGSNLVPLQTPW
jgi:7-keto-8-aminopelargonate synthetase-like enzyme